MKIGGFKLGKSKQKADPQEDEGAEIVENIIKKASEDDIPVRPHPPIQELSLDAEGGEAGPDMISIEETEAVSDDADSVKLVEVQVDPAAPVAPPAPIPVATAAKKSSDPLDLSASISNIFTDVDDEENPLVNLIKALPEVAATELLDDLKEINDIIKDWQKK